MEKVSVYNSEGQKIREEILDPAIFGLKVKPELIQLAVVALQANARRVVAHVKDRSEVRGGGRKPWRQKGTGRARHGSIRSPLWIGGGVTFGPNENRNYSLKINKKAKRKALLMALSDRALNGKIILLDNLNLTEIKAKNAYKILRNLKLRAETKKNLAKITGKEEKPKLNKKDFNKSVLLVIPAADEKIVKSFRNTSRLSVIPAQNLNILDVIKNQVLLLPILSLAKIKEIFGGKK